MDACAHIPTDDQLLDELAQLGLALARDLQQAAIAAETPDEKARLAGAFHKVARGVRQGIALKARLARDREAHLCAVGPKLARAEDEACERRRARLENHLGRVFWNEYEYADAGDYNELMGDVREVLRAEAGPGFADQDFDAQLAAYRERFNPELRDFAPCADDDAEDDDLASPDAPASTALVHRAGAYDSS